MVVCIYCKKKVEVAQHYIVTHLRRGKECPGSGDSPAKQSRDADFLEMMRQLDGGKKSK